MADAIPFEVRDDDDAPVTGAEGTFTRAAWNAWTGAPRTPSPVVAVPGVAGGYEYRPTDADANAGTVMRLDLGEGRSPRFLLFDTVRPDKTNQVIALLFTDEDGELFTGTGGVVNGWSGPATPTVFKLSHGVFVVRPTADDIAADASGFVTAPAGAYPPSYALDVEPLGESPDTPLPPQPPAPVVHGQESGTLLPGDIRLHVDSFGRGGVALVANDLETDAGLETALFLSLFTDRYDDAVEAGEARRGWWADGLLLPGDRIGSRLWRLDRAKRGPSTADELRTYAREATQWLIDDRVASAVDVTANVTADGWTLHIAVHRPRDVARFRFDRAWAAQETR